MSTTKLITRRNALIVGGATLAGLLIMPRRKVQLPPTYAHLLRIGDTITYGAQRALLSGRALAKEFSHKDISSFPATGTTDPATSRDAKISETYRNWHKNNFSNWRLSIEGLVARPGEYSLADLKRFPSRTQITRHFCEEGWSAIAEWTGVPLSRLLDAAGILPTARIVNLQSLDGWTDGIDMLDALHPQTILAYGMNGRDLLVPHGAPVRIRVETQVGYKSMKYLTRLIVTDNFDFLDKSGAFKSEWSWHAGI
jgi:DMSO/TMAO reductase YedYZ molybdopterin-dependent catalytic subunit